MHGVCEAGVEPRDAGKTVQTSGEFAVQSLNCWLKASQMERSDWFRAHCKDPKRSRRTYGHTVGSVLVFRVVGG